MKIAFGKIVCLLVLATHAVAGTAVAGDKIDESPLPVEIVEAFPGLRIERPVIITHAGDGTNRLFVGGQKGKIHIIPNSEDVKKSDIFLDITDRVEYKDRENEEGLLGLAFHPKYRENGQFFVYYTTKHAPHTSIISRFRVTPNDPGKADPASEEEILRIPQPFWNHNGGTIVFGPDGYLYIGLGDGGKANDPQMNGQNLHTLLGSILRIDVDRTSKIQVGKDSSISLNYAIPKDNPFVGQPSIARGEIWAYGLRNVWRMSFDRQTGDLWAADVGQNLWEEVNLIKRGGNYGWNFREAKHDFGFYTFGQTPNLIEPVWEYHHNIGKSVTGGHVYRGKKVPELSGHYLYGDYVSGKIWALKLDDQKQEVVANRSIPTKDLPVFTFGEDEQGEVYFSTQLGGGIIFRFQSAN